MATEPTETPFTRKIAPHDPIVALLQRIADSDHRAQDPEAFARLCNLVGYAAIDDSGKCVVSRLED